MQIHVVLSLEMIESLTFIDCYTLWLLALSLLVFLKPLNADATKWEVSLYALLLLGGLGIALRYLFFNGLGDTSTYIGHFQAKKEGLSYKWESRDWLYAALTWLTSKTRSLPFHFITGTFIILAPIVYWSKKHFNQGFWFVVLLFLAQPFFIPYAHNGIRFGMAASIFILALASKNQWYRLLFAVAAVLMHGTMLLPFLAMYFVVLFPKIRLKYYIYTSLLANLVAILLKTSWYHYLLDLLPIEYFYRMHFYLSEMQYNHVAIWGGFRWDFWLYGFLFIVWSAWVVKRYQWRDPYFIFVAKLYTLIHAITPFFYAVFFANRFGMLAWFLTPLLMALPLQAVEGKPSFKKYAFIAIGVQCSLYTFLFYVWPEIKDKVIALWTY